MKITGKFLEKIKVADKKSRSIFQNAMRDASTVVMESVIREAPASTGNLRKSIRRELSGSGLAAEIFPSVRYGEDLHGNFEETDGQYTAPHMIPAREAKAGGTLYRWAKKKGLNPYAVRASIAKKGVKRNRYMKRGAENSNSAVETVFEKAIDQVAGSLAD